MDVDWWHVGSVAVLSLALGGEVLGAYCARKERLSEWRGRLINPPPPPGDFAPGSVRVTGRITGWSRLWLKAAPREGMPGAIDAV